jgi:hypothetical protein
MGIYDDGDDDSDPLYNGSMHPGSIDPRTDAEKNSSFGEIVKNNIKSLGHGLAQALHITTAPPDKPEPKASEPAKAMAPQQPVSHPAPPPIKRIGATNGGHATTHPPVSPASHAAPARHTRPAHAVAKPTGGTQQTHSSGSKAGAPPKKHKKTHAKKKKVA